MAKMALTATEKSHQMHVMKSFRLYFRVLKVYNWSNFRGSPNRTLRNVCQLLFVMTLIVCQVAYMILQYWTFFETREALNPYTLPSLSIGYQMLLTHFSGSANNRLISETLRRLQNAIDFRWYHPKMAFVPHSIKILVAKFTYVSIYRNRRPSNLR